MVQFVVTCTLYRCSGTFLIVNRVSLLVRCPDFGGCNAHAQGVGDCQMWMPPTLSVLKKGALL